MKLYVAGPMSGYPEFNYQQFRAIAEVLRGCGYAVENPADNAKPDPETWEGYMRTALRQMLTCEGVAVLHGWQESRGAAIEVDIAHKLGMPVLPWQVWYERPAA